MFDLLCKMFAAVKALLKKKPKATLFSLMPADVRFLIAQYLTPTEFYQLRVLKEFSNIDANHFIYKFYAEKYLSEVEMPTMTPKEKLDIFYFCSKEDALYNAVINKQEALVTRLLVDNTYGEHTLAMAMLKAETGSTIVKILSSEYTKVYLEKI